MEACARYVLSSRGKSKIEFIDQWPEFLAKSLVDRAENVVGFEMFAIDAATRAYVVAHLLKPGELVDSEGDVGGALFFQPGCELLADVFFERLEVLCSSATRTKETKSVNLRVCDLIFGALGSEPDWPFRHIFLECIPDCWDRLRTKLWFEFGFEFAERLFCESLVERSAVKNLKRFDLGFVLFDVFAKGTNDTFGLLFRSCIVSSVRHNIDCRHVDCLFILLFDSCERVAHFRLIEWQTCFRNHFFARLGEKLLDRLPELHPLSSRCLFRRPHPDQLLGVARATYRSGSYHRSPRRFAALQHHRALVPFARVGLPVSLACLHRVFQELHRAKCFRVSRLVFDRAVANRFCRSRKHQLRRR